MDVFCMLRCGLASLIISEASERKIIATIHNFAAPPIRTDAEYEVAVSALNGLLDSGGASEHHPLAVLAQTLGELIGDYDDIRLLQTGSPKLT